MNRGYPVLARHSYIQDMRKEDLIKFIKGSKDEIFEQSVIDWVKASPENQRCYNKLKAEYVSEFQIEQYANIDKEFKLFQKRKNQSSSQNIILRVAAVIAIALLTGSGWFLMERNRATAPMASYEAKPSFMKEVILPDGSKVFLNSESQIELSHDFNRENREVYLEGEAFFEVERDEARPFIVKTASDLKVRVLGTSFNVKSYKTDRTIETTLVSGKVELLQNKKEKTPIALSPNQKATYNKVEEKINIDQVSTTEITAWKHGVLIFDNEPVQNVLNSLERWYDVKISIADREIKTYTFSGKVERKAAIEEVLELIEASSPVKYKYDEKMNSFILSRNK